MPSIHPSLHSTVSGSTRVLWRRQWLLQVPSCLRPLDLRLEAAFLISARERQWSQSHPTQCIFVNSGIVLLYQSIQKDYSWITYNVNSIPLLIITKLMRSKRALGLKSQ